jgi:hypothetical protein
MPTSIPDWITSLAGVGVMTGAFVYCGVEFVRDGNRRLKGIVGDVPAAYRPRAELEARVVRDQLVAREVNRVLDPELERLAPLYVQASADAEDDACEADRPLVHRVQINTLHHP